MEKIAWRGYADFCTAVFWRFYEERALQTAGSLTYTTLLSLVPLFTVALAVATAFPVFDQSIVQLQDFILENFLPDARGIDTIVIAGGSGFLGSALAASLTADRHHVTILTRQRADPTRTVPLISRVTWTPDGAAGTWATANYWGGENMGNFTVTGNWSRWTMGS